MGSGDHDAWKQIWRTYACGYYMERTPELMGFGQDWETNSDYYESNDCYVDRRGGRPRRWQNTKIGGELRRVRYHTELE